LRVAISIVLLGLSYPTYVVGVAFNVWQPLTRPRGVPQRAHYVDAFKSAAWFDCAVDSRRNVNVGEAWDEEGRLIAFGDYRLDGENRAARDVELRPWKIHGGPNGNPKLAWIYLFGSKDASSLMLVPINSAGQPLERFEVH
jgi:hypothetical protein